MGPGVPTTTSEGCWGDQRDTQVTRTVPGPLHAGHHAQLPAAVECWRLVAQSCPVSRELPSATQKPQGLGGSTSLLLSIPVAGSKVSVSPACSKIPPTGRLKLQMLISHSSGGKKSNIKVRVVVTAPFGACRWSPP